MRYFEVVLLIKRTITK